MGGRGNRGPGGDESLVKLRKKVGIIVFLQEGVENPLLFRDVGGGGSSMGYSRRNL